MARPAALILLILATAAVLFADTLNFDINRQSRKIQHDGFLMEWNGATARYWDNSGNFIWDAAITSEGVAGYFRSRKRAECTTWSFAIASAFNKNVFTLQIPEDTTSKSSELRLDKMEFEQKGTVTVEWLVPLIGYQATDTIKEEIYLKGSSSCGDTFPVIHLSFTPEKKPPKTKSSGIATKVILFLLLGGMYLLVQRKIKHQTEKRESPRQ